MLSVTFCGATRTVTGSMYYLEYVGADGGKFKFCLDAGMFQIGSKVSLHKINSHLVFDPKKLDAIVLTHAHLDHCGRIPYLVRRGFGGTVYSTPATKEIAEVVMRDSARLSTDEESKDEYYFPVKGMRKIDLESKDIDFKIKDLADKIPTKDFYKENLGLYTEEDVYIAVLRFKTFDYHKKFLIHPDLEIEFYDAGHILGSAYVKITELKTGREIVFSGDLGNLDKPIIQDPENPKDINKATHVFIETTYGNRDHGHLKPKEKLQKVCHKTLYAGGKVIIPSFSVERAQEIIYFLVELMRVGSVPKVPIFLDSPMASKVLKICLDHPELYDQELREKITQKAHPLIYKNLIVLETVDQSKTLNGFSKPCIIIAGSGMVNGGRILKHLAFHASDEKNTLLIVGYQAQGTYGRKIIDGAKILEIENKEVEIKASLEVINEFSGHADRGTLQDWLAGIVLNKVKAKLEPTKVFLMHGEKDSSLAFGDAVERFFSDRVVTHWPHFGEKIVLWN